MRAQQERQFDEYERAAFIAMMHENASRIKRPKLSDLFKRPLDVDLAETKTKEMTEKSRHATEWMSQFTIFSDANLGGGKE